MNYRMITNTGPQVSTLALGGNIFGYSCNALETQEILHAAETLGVNLVDTADVYSEGRSEEMIGQAIRTRRDRWVIATKVGVQSGSTGHGLGTRRNILARAELSLRRLRTDYIDIYQLHHFDPETPPEETIAAFEDLRTQGKIRHFGLSNCTASQVNDLIDVARKSGRPAPATNQIHYNLLKRQTAAAFLKGESPLRTRLLIYGTLGRGILSGKYRSGELPGGLTRAAMSGRVLADLQPAVLNAVDQLSKFAREAGITMTQLAIAYVLRPNTVPSTLVGIRSIAQLQDCVHGAGLNLHSNFWARVDAYLATVGDFDSASLGQPQTSPAAHQHTRRGSPSGSHHKPEIPADNVPNGEFTQNGRPLLIGRLTRAADVEL